ncbi:MAG TPA: hypothetical protein DD376_01685, partial [Sutterella sp.]|nr:hypothetical protein [Sutterella sp.]
MTALATRMSLKRLKRKKQRKTVMSQSPENPDLMRRYVITSIAAAFLTLKARPVQALIETSKKYETRTDVQAWAQEIATRYGLNPSNILATLAKARHVKTSVRLLAKSASESDRVRDWRLYRQKFLTDERIKKGAKFMRRYAKWLEYAEEHWGIPSSILTAVLGIETLYGQSIGRFRALDVLTTLSFDHERRSAFFREELAAYLALCDKGHFNPVTQRASYAGAIGMPQFMPTNILKYGVDLDGDGKPDLIHSAADAIAST